MENLKIFENAEFGKVRVAMNGDEPMFCLSDVCKVLELSNPTIVAQRLEDDERTKLDLGRQGETTFVSESGLYAVVLRSDKPKAKTFRKWVTSEVLPSIRKTGAYAIQGGIPSYQISDPIERAKKWIEEETIRQEQAKQLEVQKPKADYYDGLVERGNNLNFRDTAKLLGIGEKAFIFMLIDKKYIYRDAKGKLKPIAQYVGKFFELKEWTTNDKSGTQTLITVKGRERFAELIKEVKGV